MNFFGVYHSGYARSNGGICDAPCVTKGGMSLSAAEAVSEGGLIAMAEGRLRNREELRSALGDPGASGAKLVLLAYEKWGEDYPEHIEGPVLTCVMDASADAMVLSRDRMGEQPVFYARRGDSVIFADHPDSMLRFDGSLAGLGEGGLRELFALGPARTPGRTYYEDMFALEPGCALVLRGNGMRTRRYFSIEAAPHGDGEEETILRTRALLEQCVDDVAALNPMVMLSGGLDSTALTALLCRRAEGVQSFSVDYFGNERDFRANAFRPELDAPYVRLAVQALGTQHRTVTLEAGDLAAAMSRAVALRGFPGMADIDSSLLLFAREIARHGRYVVSGECGDEVFGGYPWFRGDAPMDGFPWSGSMELRESLLLPEAREALKLGEYARDVFETRRAAADPGPEYAPGERRLKAMQKLCFEYFMTNLQERAVCMCGGAGVRVLTPLCDDRLVRYVYNVPWEMKFMGGQEKGLFRAAVRDLLPERLLRRRKSPYPKTCSPEFSRIVRGMAFRLAADRDAPIFRVIDRRRVAELAEGELNPADTPWFGQLMAGPQLLGYLWQVNRWMKERNVGLGL